MDEDPFAPDNYLTGAGPLLEAALATAGATIRHPRPIQVTYRPGKAITVAATMSWRGGPGRDDRVVVHAARRPLRGIAPVAEDGAGNAVHVFPAAWDPALPGLARALDAEVLSGLFADLGIGLRGGRVTPRLKAYRPLRRAVVDVAGPTGRIFLKVLPPDRVEPLHLRHRLLEGHVAVPQSVGWTDDGIVVLAAMPGRSMRDALLGGAPVPPLAEIEAVLDRLPDELVAHPGAAGPLSRIGAHVELVGAVVPDLASRLAALADGLAPFAAADPPPVVAHHGDLYEGQLMVDGGRVTGLLDVDGAGAGHRIGDLANLLGHLSLLGRALDNPRCNRLGARWIAQIDGTGAHDPAALRARVSAVVLGLSTGCFRVQDKGWPAGTRKRVALAEEWLASARRAARN